jgi:hypothetical protein
VYVAIISRLTRGTRARGENLKNGKIIILVLLVGLLMPIKTYFISDDTETLEVKLREIAVQKASEKYDIEKELLGALIEHESGNEMYARRYDYKPLSKQAWVSEAMTKHGLKGNEYYYSVGYTQMLYLVAVVQYGFKGTIYELYDPMINIDMGARHLAWNLKRYGGDVEKALSSYNAGSYTESNRHNYIEKVIKIYRRLKNANP